MPGFDLTALLNKYSEQQILTIYNLLKQDKKNASYNLLQSLDYKTLLQVDQLRYEIEFTGIDYLKYVRSGRRAGAKPPPTQAIKDYLRVKGIPEKFAIPVKKAIAAKGIRPYDFVELAFTDANLEKLGGEISQLLQSEITNRIKTQIEK